jgi:hypothetical protein
MVEESEVKTIKERPIEDNANEAQSSSPSQVVCETYPVAQPLATILNQVYVMDQDHASNETETETGDEETIQVVRDSVEDALQNLVRNCFVAMDEMYFYS